MESIEQIAERNIMLNEIRELKHDVFILKKNVEELKTETDKLCSVFAANNNCLTNHTTAIKKMDVSLHRYKFVFNASFKDRLKFLFTNKL